MADVNPGGAVPDGGNLPTRKWWAARVAALAALIVMYITTDGGWDDEEWVALVGLIAEGVISYLVPNARTVGGAPAR